MYSQRKKNALFRGRLKLESGLSRINQPAAEVAVAGPEVSGQSKARLSAELKAQ
jgi:hypothetical protein